MTAFIIGWEEIALISILLLITVIVFTPKLLILIVLLTCDNENAESKFIIMISVSNIGTDNYKWKSTVLVVCTFWLDTFNKEKVFGWILLILI